MAMLTPSFNENALSLRAVNNHSTTFFKDSRCYIMIFFNDIAWAFITVIVHYNIFVLAIAQNPRNCFTKLSHCRWGSKYLSWYDLKLFGKPIKKRRDSFFLWWWAFKSAQEAVRLLPVLFKVVGGWKQKIVFAWKDSKTRNHVVGFFQCSQPACLFL